MAMRVETNPLEAAYAVLLEMGLDGAGEALRILVNEAAKAKRTEYLGAQPYERTATRRDYANGFKPKTMLARFGNITFQVPQVRCGNIYPFALEKGTRTEQAVNLALAEMYVQGVCTRRVIEVLQKLVGPDLPLSHAQVSRAAAKLDEGLKAWRERPLKRGTLSVSGCDLPQGASARPHRRLRGPGLRQAPRAGLRDRHLEDHDQLAALPAKSARARPDGRKADRL